MSASSSSPGMCSASGWKYLRPSNSEPLAVRSVRYSDMFASFMNSSSLVVPTTQVSPPTRTYAYSSSGCSPTMASVTRVNGMVVHTTRYASSSRSLTL